MAANSKRDVEITPSQNRQIASIIEAEIKQVIKENIGTLFFFPKDNKLPATGVIVEITVPTANAISGALSRLSVIYGFEYRYSTKVETFGNRVVVKAIVRIGTAEAEGVGEAIIYKENESNPMDAPYRTAESRAFKRAIERLVGPWLNDILIKMQDFAERYLDHANSAALAHKNPYDQRRAFNNYLRNLAIKAAQKQKERMSMDWPTS
jgi:hypothetical protein